MKYSLGKKNIFIHLNSTIAVEPVLFALYQLAMADLDKQITLLTDSKIGNLSDMARIFEVIHIDRNDYQSSSVATGDIGAALVPMNNLIDTLESGEYTKAFTIGTPSWGQWITASLAHCHSNFLNISNSANSVDIYNNLTLLFGIRPNLHKPAIERVLLDFSSLVFEIQEIFSFENLAVYCPWLQVRTNWDWSKRESDTPNTGIVTGNWATALAMSMNGRQVLFIDGIQSDSDKNLFLPTQSCLKVDTQVIEQSSLFSLISLWKAGRLSEAGFLQLGRGAEVSQISQIGPVLARLTSTDTAQEFRLIQDLTHMYRSMMVENGEISVDLVASYLQRHFYDPYLISSSLATIKLIALRMIESLGQNERLLEQLGNDFYKISVAHEIIEQVIINPEVTDLKKQLPSALSHFLAYIDEIQALTEGHSFALKK